MEIALIIITGVIALAAGGFCWLAECYKTAIVLPLLIAAFGIWGAVMEYGTVHDVTFTVSSLDDQGGTSHKYLLFTTDGREYENTDAWLHGKTDSSDVWSRFLAAGPGATWTCPVYGYRRHFPTSYQDILDGCRLRHAGYAIPSAAGADHAA